MGDTATVDTPIQATVRVRESLWKRIKIEAIKRGCTVADVAEQFFEQGLQESDRPKKAKESK